MRILLILFICFNAAILSAQNLNVSISKKANRVDGSKLEYKDAVSVKDTVIIKKDGVLVLNNETGLSFTLNEGKHSIYEYYVLNKTKISRQDSISSLMKKFNLFNCKFLAQRSCLGSDKKVDLYAGFIAFDIDDKDVYSKMVIESKTNLITINWIHPTNFKGLSFIIVKNLFEDILGYEVTEKNSITLDFKKYNDKMLVIKIKSEDCTESQEFRISLVKRP